MNESMKRFFLSILYFAIFVILFNVIFFFSIANYTTTRWISYAGIHLTYLFFIISSFSISKAKSGVIFGFPKILIGTLMFMVEFVVGVLFILINNDSYVFPMVIQAIIIAFYVGEYIIMMIAESHTLESDRSDANDLYFIKNASYSLQSTMNKVNDNGLYKTIEKLYDAVKSAQVRSIPSAKEEESRLMDVINEINLEVLNGNKDKISQLVAQGLTLIDARNNKIKLSR